MPVPPFGEPGVCPRIVLFSSTTNQFLIGGAFPTELFRLSPPATEPARRAKENSPTIDRWVTGSKRTKSRQGRKKAMAHFCVTS